MFSIDQLNNIKLTRKDTLDLDVKTYHEDGTEHQLVDGDRMIFRMGSGANIEKELVIDLVNNVAILHLDSNDTKDLMFTTYKYEIEFLGANGQVNTVVENKNFTIGIEQG